MEDMVELKESFDGFRRDWETFKKTNDERLKKVEKKEFPRAEELDQQLDKIHENMEGYEKKVAALEAANEKKDQELADLIAKVEAPGFGKTEEEKFDAKIGLSAMVKQAVIPRNNKVALTEMETKVLDAENNTLGGFTVESQVMSELLKGITEISPIRSIARVMSTTVCRCVGSRSGNAGRDNRVDFRARAYSRS
jgi:HK97 family phage major capsid protein